MGNKIARRDFIAKTALATCAIMAAPALSKETEKPFAWTPRKAVNSAIDNLRVVCGVNPAMVTGTPNAWDMDGQNGAVAAEPVEKTMDAIACKLAQSPDPSAAWKTLLRKPDTKPWSAVKAAIKVNCIALNHPRIPVVNKVCMELNRLGVPFGNIILYDGVHNALPLYGAFVGKGLPTGVVVSDKHAAMGGTVKLRIPQPNAGEYSCSRYLADGTIDILINIAVNKGHSENLGKTTLTLKNHAGTFDPKHIHLLGGLDYILAFNKSDAFWGGTPVRQQLCIVDSLWGAINGPGGVPDKRLDRLVMGTFSGAVDYLTVKKIREPLLGAKHGPVERFVTEFGYEEKELGDLVSITL